MKTILITGATSGIGYELARKYEKFDDRLILIGRRARTTLDLTFFTPERYCQANLADPSAATIIRDFLTEQGIDQLDTLIHNAGTGYFGDIPQQSPASITDVINVNLSAPIRLTHALLPHLIAAQGKIVLISSVVANLPAPEYAVYAASKAALDEFGNNLRIELKTDDVRVQVIHPGATQTQMHAKLGIPPERMDTSQFPSAKIVATYIINAISSNTPQLTIGYPNKFMRFAGKYTAGLVDMVMKRSQNS